MNVSQHCGCMCAIFCGDALESEKWDVKYNIKIFVWYNQDVEEEEKETEKVVIVVAGIEDILLLL